MDRKIWILFFPFFWSSNLYAQKEADNWFFGLHCSINFSTGQPIVNNQNPNYIEQGAVTMSDHSGNLLFYGNGYKIYNRLHHVMPGCATGMLGLPAGFGQPALALPYP